MGIKFYIDEKQYKIIDHKEYIKLIGWAFSTSNEPLTFILNDSPLDESMIDSIYLKALTDIYPQYHLSGNKGFSILIPLSVINNQLDLKVKDSSSTKRLIKLSNTSINRLKNNSSIIYHIDAILKRGKRLNVVGWGVSNYDKEVNYKVLDKNNNEIESIHRSIERNDLYVRRYLEENEKNSGFGVSFPYEKNKKYTFVITDGSSEIKINVNHLYNKQRILNVLRFVKKVIKKIKPSVFKQLYKQVKHNGFKSLPGYIKSRIYLYGKPYEKWFEEHKVTNQELEIQRNTKFNYEPLISILVPTYKTPINFLQEMIDSVRNQSYSNWELCIADGSEGDKEVEEELEKYHQLDARIKYKILEKNLMISGNTNECLTLATGEYISLFDHDDLLAPNALYEIVKALNEDDYDFIYTDEDKVIGEDKEHADPHFKPDFDIDLLESENYITHFTTIRTSIVKDIGGFRSKYDGAQDYDIILRSIEKSKKIKHIPMQLYHWRIHSLSTAGNPESKTYAYDAGVKALQDHFDRIGRHAKASHFGEGYWGVYKATYYLTDSPLLSIIIPSRDHINELRNCIDSLDKSIYQNYEIIIVENNSTNKETFDYYKELESKNSKVKVVTCNLDSFNFSTLINYGVSQSNGDYLLLLNNDTELISEDALVQMLSICEREDVGAVGAKLLYKDDFVQHAGIVVGFNKFSTYINTDIDKDSVGFMIHPRINREYSAVTASCMMTSRVVFNKVKGFDEEYPVLCNEVDYCLKVRKQGYNIVQNNYSLWYHQDNATLGYVDLNNNNIKVEVSNFKTKWQVELNESDPMYNPNFTYKDVPYTLE